MFKDKRTAMVGTLVLALFLLSLTLTNPGKALAVDAFLKIEGVPGSVTDAKHKDEIAVIGWSFGDTQPVVATSGVSASPGRPKMQDLKITMRTNKASPKLFLGAASGQRFGSAELSVWKSGGSRFLDIKLSDVIVSSFVSLGSSGSTDAYPMEEIMLNFAKIEITYTELDSKTGASQGDTKINLDVTKMISK
jgi:type VI secretion system secreted protein Hcp